MAIKYTELLPSTEYGAYCFTCESRKGFLNCPNCDDTPFCVTCTDVTPCCSEEVTFS